MNCNSRSKHSWSEHWRHRETVRVPALLSKHLYVDFPAMISYSLSTFAIALIIHTHLVSREGSKSP
jgi:hypothetical protein